MTKQAGFTLIELLVTMTVAVVLTAIAVPNFKLTFQNNRMTGQSNDLLGAMLYARSEAIALNTNVTVCSSTDGATCSSSAAWASGWIACQDPNTTVTNCSGGTVLRFYPALTGGNTLTSSFGASVVFQPSGTLTSGAAGTFSLCDSRGASSGRSISLTATGIARVSTKAGKLIDGATNLTC